MVQGQEKAWSKKNLPRDWHLRSFEKDGVYGAAVYDAYEYLKGREPKRRVVVAVIDAGKLVGERGGDPGQRSG